MAVADYAQSRTGESGGPSPRVAALLTLLTPGLGHIYLGLVWRGIALFALVIVADTLLMFSLMGVLARFWMFAISLVLLFGLWLYIDRRHCSGVADARTPGPICHPLADLRRYGRGRLVHHRYPVPLRSTPRRRPARLFPRDRGQHGFTLREANTSSPTPRITVTTSRRALWSTHPKQQGYFHSRSSPSVTASRRAAAAPW
jgi:hypothetical protein